MRFQFLLVFLAIACTSGKEGSKRAQISGSHGIDPYGTITAVIPPVAGAPIQSSVSQDGLATDEKDLDADLDLNGRYQIPNFDGFTHQGTTHSDSLALDSHSIHLSAHPIPYGGRGGYDSDLCHEGYDDFCYSPYGYNYAAHHDLIQDPHGHWGDIQFGADAFPHFVGNVLSNSDAVRLGFDQSYLKKLGFDGRVWHHNHHIGTHYPHVGGHIFPHGTCQQSIDIAFVVDGSTEKSDFGKLIDFIIAVVGKLPISEFGTRVALLTFGDKGEMKFGFDKFLTKVAVAHALLDVKEKYTKKDGRKLGDALKIAKTDLFDVSGRDEKHKILVVLSDGAAGDSFNEFSQALKDMAVSIYFVGPKANLKTEQVKALVSDKDDWFSFVTDDYEKMIRDVAPVFPPIGCTVDIVFVLDCTKGDDAKLNEQKAFIRHSISGLNIGTRGDHVSVVTYGGKSEVKFNLNKKSHLAQFSVALQELECGKGGAADAAPALGLVKDVFEKSGHQGSINVTVYVSGSKTASNIADPAKALRNMGVRVYGVGYGKDVNEDDMKKIASLPSDYFVYVKDDEKKMVAMVGHVLLNHLAELKGLANRAASLGHHSWLHSPFGVGGGLYNYGGWGGAYMKSLIEPSSYSDESLQNLQDDTANVLKEIANTGVDQDGFTSSISPKAPELSGASSEDSVAEYGKDKQQESIRDESGVDRAKIENEPLSVPAFDASQGDYFVARKPHTRDFSNKKRTVRPKRGKKKSYRRRKSHKKAATNRNNIEGSIEGKNETAGKNETEASSSVQEASKDGTKASGDVANETATVSGQNLTASSNATPSTRGKIDPYSNIGSDVSSMESASNMKINIDKDSSTSESSTESGEVRSHAPGQGKTETSAAVHNDIIDMAREYKEDNKEAEKIISKMKEGVAVKKHMTKDEVKSLETPVHALVKSIFHKAAKNVMKDFSKSNGLQSIAKMLVKAAVHNAMLGRPSAEKALEIAEKAKKQSKQPRSKKDAKKKKAKKAHTRSLKRKLDAAKLVKDDLMAIGRQKVTKSGSKIAKNKIEKNESSVVNEE